jgi:hypothetical protein
VTPPRTWGDLQALQPGVQALPEETPEDNQFQGIVINMREVKNQNIRDGVIRTLQRKREEKTEKIRRLSEFE